MRRLIQTVCRTIESEKINSHLETAMPASLRNLDIDALLLHVLTVLISYHKHLEVRLEEASPDMRNYKAEIVRILVAGLGKDEAVSKPCLEANLLPFFILEGMLHHGKSMTRCQCTVHVLSSKDLHNTISSCADN